MADNVFFRLARKERLWQQRRPCRGQRDLLASQRDYRRARRLGLTVAQYRMQYRVQLAGCGVWQPVTLLPHVCPTCGQRYLEGPS